MFEKIIFNKKTVVLGLLGTFFIIFGAINLIITFPQNDEVQKATDWQLFQIPLSMFLLIPILVLQLNLGQFKKSGNSKIVVFKLFIFTVASLFLGLITWLIINHFEQGYFYTTAVAQMIPLFFSTKEVFIKVFPNSKFVFFTLTENALNWIIPVLCIFVIVILGWYTPTEIKNSSDAINDGVTLLTFGMFILVLASDKISCGTFTSLYFTTNQISSTFKLNSTLTKKAEAEIIEKQFFNLVNGLGYSRDKIQNFNFKPRPDNSYDVTCQIK